MIRVLNDIKPTPDAKKPMSVYHFLILQTQNKVNQTSEVTRGTNF